jgi:hypothetical protein
VERGCQFAKIIKEKKLATLYRLKIKKSYIFVKNVGFKLYSRVLG